MHYLIAGLRYNSLASFLGCVWRKEGGTQIKDFTLCMVQCPDAAGRWHLPLIAKEREIHLGKMKKINRHITGPFDTNSWHHFFYIFACPTLTSPEWWIFLRLSLAVLNYNSIFLIIYPTFHNRSSIRSCQLCNVCRGVKPVSERQEQFVLLALKCYCIYIVVVLIPLF